MEKWVWGREPYFSMMDKNRYVITFSVSFFLRIKNFNCLQLSDCGEQLEQRLIKRTLVFQILVASACPYQRESHVSTYYFYSQLYHSTVIFALEDVKLLWNMVTSSVPNKQASEVETNHCERQNFNSAVPTWVIRLILQLIQQLY